MSVSSHPYHRDKPMQREPTENLLCDECEGLLGSYETRTADTIRLLRKTQRKGRIVTIPDDKARCENLRLFVLANLWRCHVSEENHGLSSVDLGYHAQRIRQILLGEAELGQHSNYPLIVCRIDGADHTNAMHEPKQIRLHGLNAQRFMAQGFEWIQIVSNEGQKALEWPVPFIGEYDDVIVPVYFTTDDKLRRRLYTKWPK